MAQKKKTFILLALVFCLLTGGVSARAQQEELPTTKAGWIKRLSKITDLQSNDWYTIYRFRMIDPELSYSVIKELWGKKVSETLKTQLLQNFSYDYGEFIADPKGGYLSNPNINPHLLEIFDLGIGDASQGVRQTALSSVFEVAMRDFEKADDYKKWRKVTAGRTIADLAKENCRALFEKFVKGKADERAKLLPQISRLSFSSGTYSTIANGKETRGVIANGLTGIRRQMALDTGLLDAVATMMKTPDENAAQQVSYFLMGFSPDDNFLKKIEPDVRVIIEKAQAKKISDSYPTVWFISNYKSKWATDALLKIVAARYPGEMPWMLTNALCTRDDPCAAPYLIAALDDCSAGEDSSLNNALARITGVKPDADADADWWRAWWHKNRGKFAPEVAALPIPKFKSANFNVVAIRRKKTLLEIGDDARRAYWLISSGLIVTADNGGKAQVKTVGNGKTRYTISQNAGQNTSKPIVLSTAKKPGLLVVLTDSMENIEAQKLGWQQIAGKAFAGKYLIALARSPQADAKQSLLWPVQSNQSGSQNAAAKDNFLTEKFVAAIVQDVEAKYPVNPERVFLAGIGAGGSAAYACSLEAQTPFHGYFLLDAPFRSAQLPPLASAKNRKYYLLHHKQNKLTPFFIAAAAQQSLQKAGGAAKLTEYSIESKPPLLPDADAFAQAIFWLQK